MNSTEFYIAAGDAICEWDKTNNEPCILFQNDGFVKCRRISKNDYYRDNPLRITPYEISHGMTPSRWNQIGTELHNLYCKEKACQARQKP